MTIKEKLLLDLQEIKNPNLLNQIFEFIQILKKNYTTSNESNKAEVWKSIASISASEASEIQNIVNDEFNNIEGDWE